MVRYYGTVVSLICFSFRVSGVDGGPEDVGVEPDGQQGGAVQGRQGGAREQRLCKQRRWPRRRRRRPGGVAHPAGGAQLDPFLSSEVRVGWGPFPPSSGAGVPNPVDHDSFRVNHEKPECVVLCTGIPYTCTSIFLNKNFKLKWCGWEPLLSIQRASPLSVLLCRCQWLLHVSQVRTITMCYLLQHFLTNESN